MKKRAKAKKAGGVCGYDIDGFEDLECHYSWSCGNCRRFKKKGEK